MPDLADWEPPWGMYHSQTSRSAELAKDQTSFILPPSIGLGRAFQQHYILDLSRICDVVRRNNKCLSNLISHPGSFYSISDHDRGFPTSNQLSVALSIWCFTTCLTTKMSCWFFWGWRLGVAAGRQDSFRRWSSLMSPMHRFYSGATYLSSLHWCLTPFPRLGCLAYSPLIPFLLIPLD